jgi:hypothetical protein
MPKYSSNLLVNSEALQPITTGWSASSNVTIVAAGSDSKAFRFLSSSTLEQSMPVSLFEKEMVGIKVGAKVRFTNATEIIFTAVQLYIKVKLIGEETRTFTLPCHAVIKPGMTDWIEFSGEADMPYDEYTSVLFSVYTIDTALAVDVDYFNLQLISEEANIEEILEETKAFTENSLLAHLEDVHNSHLTDEQKLGYTGGAQRVRTNKFGLENDVEAINRVLFDGYLPVVKFKARREKTPIVTPEFWEELLVQTIANVTSTSVAVEYSARGIGKVYVAYIADGVLTVKSSQFGYPLSEMIWAVDEMIPDCAQCAIDFDGSFVKTSPNTNAFYTEEIPYLAYTNLSGQLNVGSLGGPYDTVVGAGVLSVDLTRGIASIAKDFDLGLIAFYIINGYVYFRQLIRGTWQDQQIVSIAPANAVKLRADRTFDWRHCLQILDSAGALHEVFSMPYYSGHIGVENLTMKVPSISLDVKEIHYISAKSEDEYITATVSGITIQPKYALSPVMKSAYNAIYTNAELEVENDYGYKVVIEFDEIVDSVSMSYNSFVLEDSMGQAVYPFAAESITGRTIAVYFMNFNNAVGEVSVSYNGSGLVGEIGQSVDADSVSFVPTGLVPFYVAPPVVVGITNIQDWEVPS